MSKQQELDRIENQIKTLQNRKKLLEQKNKVKQRKMLTKQKILVGGYLLNNLDRYIPPYQQASFFDDLEKTISKSRKADIDAIADLKNNLKG